MKNIRTSQVLVLAILVLFPVAVVVAALGGGGSGGGTDAISMPAGQGVGDQVQLRDQDQVRDPTTRDGIEPDQDRLRTQDRDRIMLASSTTPGSAFGVQNQVRTQAQERAFVVGATNTSQQLRVRIQEREQRMEQERVSATTSQLQETLREQNRSRIAVQAMLDVNALFGERAEEANRVAAEIRASVDRTVEMEEKIQSRGFFRRVFMGGDVETAAQLEVEVLQTRDRIRDMDRLVQDCQCDGPTRDLLQEQLRILEQDRDRLNTLAVDQTSRTGLFGWLFR